MNGIKFKLKKTGFKYLGFLLFFGFCTFTFAEGRSMKKSEAQNEFMLYLCGKMGGGGFYYANGVLLATPNISNGYSKLAVFSDSTYLIHEDNSNSGNAGYWRNGNWISVASKSSHIQKDICATSAEVFIVGGDRDSITIGMLPCVWTKGIKNYLPLPPNTTFSTGVAVARFDSHTYIACDAEYKTYLWKDDGSITQLSDSNSNVLSAHVYKGDICVAGYDNLHFSEDEGASGSWYWYKGKKHYIYFYGDTSSNNPAYMLRVQSFYTNDTCLYAVGDIPTYPPTWFLWKNGIPTQINDSTVTNAEYHAIAVYNGKVILAGKYWQNGAEYLCVWIDGVRQTLSGPTSGIIVRSIVVQPPLSNKVIPGYLKTKNKIGKKDTCTRISMGAACRSPLKNVIKYGIDGKQTEKETAAGVTIIRSFPGGKR